MPTPTPFVVKPGSKIHDHLAPLAAGLDEDLSRLLYRFAGIVRLSAETEAFRRAQGFMNTSFSRAG